MKTETQNRVWWMRLRNKTRGRGGGSSVKILSPVLFGWMKHFQLQKWLKMNNTVQWTSRIIFLPFFFGFQDKYTKRLTCYHKGEEGGDRKANGGQEGSGGAVYRLDT